ncbi:MAG: PorT family protein [candidate division WOR-3 bacterium]|nr:MAG: PorT family protein [candidate division WOR-3 bacterium]
MNCRFTALLVVLLCTTLSLSSAQKITGGLKLGMNLASMHGDDISDTKFKTGFCGGGFFAFALGNVVVIQPEVLYSQKGVKWEDEFLDETWKLTYKFNYIEVPIFVKMIMPLQGKVKPNLFLGPYFAIAITDSRYELEIDGMTIEDDLVGVKDTDFGLVFGGGIDFGLKKGKIVFDARYSLGLTTLDEEGEGELKNSVFTFLFGYSF